MMFELREVKGQKGFTGNWFRGEVEAANATEALEKYMMDFEGEIVVDGERAYAHCPDMQGTWIHMYQAYPVKGGGGSGKSTFEK
jgi:hypothetical protein